VSLTQKDVAEVLKLLEESAFEELVLEVDGLKIELRRGDAVKPRVLSETKSAGRDTGSSAPKPSPGTTVAATPEGMIDVPAPLLGVFYQAPKPGAEPFVKVGQQIDEDMIIGIIEVMKLMNSVRSGVRGEVVEILAENAALVEYGAPLIRVRTAE
jgi:acetyl-CoA carboxylase biotin carboxyl carrier protein